MTGPIMGNDDRTDETIPEPDSLASANERARAESFAALVERMLDGRELPPAMASEERALLETATMVRAGAGEVALEPERRRALIEEAMAQVPARHLAAAQTGAPSATIDASPTASADAGTDAGRVASGAADSDGRAGVDAGVDAGVIDLASRRRARFIPWTIAAVAAAAAVLIAITGVPWAPTSQVAQVATEPAPQIARIHQSRPADALIGRIERDQAGEASARLDVIFTDRMTGYRDIALGGGRR
jgi:hypothetical protein